MKYCMKEYVRNLLTRLSAKFDENPFDNFSVSEKNCNLSTTFLNKCGLENSPAGFKIKCYNFQTNN